MRKYKAIIVDDEFAAREVLSIHLNTIAEDIEIVATCGSFDSALNKLSEIEVDIAFIDIIMPRGNGLDLLRELPDRKFLPNNR